MNAFCDQLNLFKLGYSWGVPMSLVVPYHLFTLRGMKNGEVPKHLVNGVLVRFSIDFEGVEDLQGDLLQALEVFG